MCPKIYEEEYQESHKQALYSLHKYAEQGSPFTAKVNNSELVKIHRWLYKIARSHWLAISDYQPIITSTDKMAASSRFATVSENDFTLKCFFFSFLK